MTQPELRRLVVLRHARAEAENAGGDAGRPLALEGRRQASVVGRALRDAGLRPDVVLCSTALRTRQTWELASAAWGAQAPSVVWHDDLYDAGAADVLRCVHEVASDVRTVLVVGHEPAVSGTARLLAGSAAQDATVAAAVRVGVPVATRVVLSSALPWSAWAPGCATLEEVVAPGE